ncbi:MAG: FAD-dependent oxidoreductase [Thioalkalivibrio sp.]|nr:MAG: FAD-dependent oxidoreductase [Thioalkalivibrio sp.]
MLKPLIPVHLHWDGDVPRVLEYDDVYFSAQDPRGEVQTVFIEANDLPTRFRLARRFAIGETGFGTGLNFFLTLDAWRRHAPAGAFLSYLSAEAHPLAPADLQRALLAQGIPPEDVGRLLAQYPPPVSGLHRIHFPEDRVVLTLVYGDAAPGFANVRGAVDAWFLDGFAPSRNPALWNIAVFRQLARLSRDGTTLGTFTAAGQVRRDLTASGFDVQRRAGFRGKRERLVGRFRAAAASTGAPPERIAVIGAGIAGLSTARALRDRGAQVTVLDPVGVAARTSGNPAALLSPHLSAGDTLRNALALAGMRATRALLSASGAEGRNAILRAEGIEHRGITPHARRRLDRLAAADPLVAGDLYEVWSTDPECPVLRYPRGLGVDLGAFCRHLAQGLDVHTREVVAVAGGEPGAVLGYADGGQEAFDAAVIATGPGPVPCANQPRPLRVGGQLTRIRTRLHTLGHRALTGRGYCLPEHEGQHWLGATYRREGDDSGINDADNTRNLQQLNWADPALAAAADVTVSGAWYGTRAVFRDRFPAVGEVDPEPAGGEAGTAHAAGIPRVFVSLGHGSRGLLYAPLAAQLLADRIFGLPEVLSVPLSERLSPLRLRKTDPPREPPA